MIGGADNVSNILNSIGDCLEEPDKTLVKSLSLKVATKDSTAYVVADGNWTIHKRYPAMDRTAHLNDVFGFYLSTYSPRTILFEGTNGNDMLGWYQSAGLFYLETEDNQYYDDG